MMDNDINPEFINPANITEPQGSSSNVSPPILEIDSGDIGAFIADKIASGLLDMLGGYVFEIILPYFNAAEQAKLIRKLADMFRQVLREEEMRRANANLAALINVMNDYTHAPRGIDRLQNATFHAQELVQELKSLDLQGFGAFLIAGGLELSVIQARYWNTLTRDEGEKNNALLRIREYSIHVDRMLAKAGENFNSRFDSAPFEEPIPGVDRLGWFFRWYTESFSEMKTEGPFDTLEEANRFMNLKWEEELNKYLEKFAEPVARVKNKWGKLANQVPYWHLFLMSRYGGPIIH